MPNTESTSVRIIRKGAGEYVTEDGRFGVEFTDGVLENACECIVCQNGRQDACPHGGFANRKAWIVWDFRSDDYAKGSGAGDFSTMRQAVAWLNRRLVGGALS